MNHSGGHTSPAWLRARMDSIFHLVAELHLQLRALEEESEEYAATEKNIRLLRQGFFPPEFDQTSKSRGEE